ncbi:hypothetical protein FQN60_016686 [Etheostoma spectabile]|uniref:Uncharacterized protein n=1 Tax=Etheostoma spectabile TaxID=54343 RepID=A0A5J5D371_9PERO|nr:hypothetical protein FQN60_016120 [Etheostoma spectabile]KAA8587824.1 hypothetical protein FQN60_016686 [Etheostoma spectabile]
MAANSTGSWDRGMGEGKRERGGRRREGEGGGWRGGVGNRGGGRGKARNREEEEIGCPESESGREKTSRKTYCTSTDARVTERGSCRASGSATVEVEMDSHSLLLFTWAFQSQRATTSRARTSKVSDHGSATGHTGALDSDSFFYLKN